MRSSNSALLATMLPLTLLVYEVSSCACLAEMDARGARGGETRPECAEWGCGSDAATMWFGIFLYELAPDGAPNGSSIRIVKTQTAAGREVRVRVVEDQLTAVAIDDPTVVYRGLDVRGLTM